MTKKTIIGLLVTLCLAFSGWAAKGIVDNGKGISKLEERTSTLKGMVKDIHNFLLKKKP